MLRVGITGGIGSGKTTVCQIFQLLGVPVFNADHEAKALMVKDEILINQIRQNFGKESYAANGALNRKHISDLVFNDPERLKLLNSFVHPAVFRAMDEWVLGQKSVYVLKEAALLFETNSYLQNDFNILVSASEDVRIARVMKRDGLSKEKVVERMQNQMPDAEKKQKSDYIIDNNDTDFLIVQVLALHSEFLKIASLKN